MLTLFEVEPRVVMGLAAIAGIVIAAAFPRAPLAALNMLLGQVAAPAPTRTFIRRLLDGPIDPEASRLGSQLDAIDSGFRLLEAEQALVGVQADALTRRIQLIAALGGGFDPLAPRQAAPAADTHS